MLHLVQQPEVKFRLAQSGGIRGAVLHREADPEVPARFCQAKSIGRAEFGRPCIFASRDHFPFVETRIDKIIMQFKCFAASPIDNTYDLAEIRIKLQDHAPLDMPFEQQKQAETGNNHRQQCCCYTDRQDPEFQRTVSHQSSAT